MHVEKNTSGEVTQPLTIEVTEEELREFLYDYEVMRTLNDWDINHEAAKDMVNLFISKHAKK